MKTSYNSCAVIGLGFGDEGKGLVTNALSLQYPGSLVIRYSGGQQAGHTVTFEDGVSHVFSNFGSGSFSNTPTYWSKYCTVDPVGIMKELAILKEKGCVPRLLIDGDCPITTFFDKLANQQSDGIVENGTCGVGVGTTLQREEDFYSLVAGDLFYPEIVDIKLKLIGEYYGFDDVGSHYEFKTAVQMLLASGEIEIVDEMPPAPHYIFEGSQGLLLDQHHGFFPHVTRSNTGTKNILEMGHTPDLYLITRAYQTRHGNGPMTNEDLPHKIIDNPLETNVLHEYQGEFRKSILDLSLLDYGMMRDVGIRDNYRKHLVITCCDHIDGDFQYTINGELHSEPNQEAFGQSVGKYLGVQSVTTIASASTSLDSFLGE